MQGSKPRTKALLITLAGTHVLSVLSPAVEDQLASQVFRPKARLCYR